MVTHRHRQIRGLTMYRYLRLGSFVYEYDRVAGTRRAGFDPDWDEWDLLPLSYQ